MKNFNLGSFGYKITCEGEVTDAKLDFELNGGTLAVSITAENDRPCFAEISWNFETKEDLFVLGDAWERSYGDLCARRLSAGLPPLPWYFAAADGAEIYCLGVKTQPNAFVCFSYDGRGVRALIDCRNGGCGFKPDGRTVKLCTFVFKKYEGDLTASLHKFCGELCPAPLLPGEKIYGGNNWYYAYGESSRGDILRDAALQAELARGIENRPFMVIDDGWSVNSTMGPYIPNEKFGDMKSLASEIKSLGVRPGIWVRLLDDDSPRITDEMRILRNGERKYLDPSCEAVADYIKEEIAEIKGWGYELLKHDFSTVDLFGHYGKDLKNTITNYGGWHFADESKTSAEIVLDFYRLIKEACGDMLIIGCNTVSHLCAGLVQINRTGDDTSGREWERTRKMGVNTLAFRLAQNKAFYLVDADCVGYLGENISRERNRQWLDLLSKSDTALFTSCASLDGSRKADVRKAYLEIQKDHGIRPLDIYENLTPRLWEIDGSETAYSWD